MNNDNETSKEKHSKASNIDDVSSSFYSLIDRLQKHSEWKYPNRKWTNGNKRYGN